MAYIFLALAFTLNALGNIFLKLGAARGVTLSGNVLQLIGAHWQLLLGVGLFASNIIFYFLALRMLPLSIAYPVMVAMSFLIINGYAFFALREPLAPLQLLGYVLILVGLMLVVMRQAS